MESGKIIERNGYRFVFFTKDGKNYEVKMRPYQIPFFSIGEYVFVDTRTGYCLRQQQKSPTRYVLS